MNSVSRSRVLRKDHWEASRRAEKRGDLITALNIHRKILSEENSSYAVMVRAGWLYYRLGLYEISLRYYERACSSSKNARPLYGIMNCLTDESGSNTLASLAESIYGTENQSIRSAAA